MKSRESREIFILYRGDLASNTGEKSRIKEILKAYRVCKIIHFYLIDVYHNTEDKYDYLDIPNMDLNLMPSKGNVFIDYFWFIGCILFKFIDVIAKADTILLIQYFPMVFSPIFKIINKESAILWSLHGTAEEFLIKGSLKGKIVYAFYRFNMAISVRFIKKIFVVSIRMKEYAAKKYHARVESIFVIPCAVSSNLKYNKKADEIKKGLNLQDRLVFVYSGVFAPWQCIEKTIQLFVKIKLIEPNSFLLVLTPHIIKFEDLIHKIGLAKTDYSIISVPHPDMDKYLSLGDIGLLLRDNDVVNTTSSPTKFAEYLACGLPVITTLFVGDYSDLIKNNKMLGTIIQIDPFDIEKIREFIKFYLENKQEIKGECSSFAGANLTWDRFYDVLLDN